MDRGQEVRELKLGASFTNPNARSVFHTLKYDFKPASVDVHKEATLQTGSNNSVTVTLPHLDGSGVPNTVFKGSQKDYTKKECILIINRDTNEIILEKLHSNIQVKKTRTDSSNSKPPPPPSTSNMTAASTAGKGENLTQRHSSKTRVSTGVRKNNILNFVPKHSPLQGSPNYPHRSPQQAPLWNANNTQQTLPSIPSLLDDSSFANSQPPPSSVYNNNKSNNINASNNLNTLSASTSMPKTSGAIMQHQQQQQQQQQTQSAVDDIGELSSSSSSDSNDDDSDSDSDSADSSTNIHPAMSNIINNNNTMMVNSNHKKAPAVPSMGNHMDNSKAMLQKDLCLSDASSDSDDY